MSRTEPSTRDSTTEPTANDEYAVPDNEDPLVCEYCEAPFADEQFRALHWGLEHPGELTEDEREAFETAVDDETRDLRLFRLKAVGLLVLLYFGLVMAYAVFA